METFPAFVPYLEPILTFLIATVAVTPHRTVEAITTSVVTITPLGQETLPHSVVTVPHSVVTPSLFRSEPSPFRREPPPFRGDPPPYRSGHSPFLEDRHGDRRCNTPRFREDTSAVLRRSSQ